MHCGSGRAQCFVTMETKWIWDAQSKTSSIQITLKDGKGKKSANLAQCREVLLKHGDLNDTKPLPKREAGATKRGSAPSLPSTAWFLPPQPLALTFCLSFQKGYTIQEPMGKNLHSRQPSLTWASLATCHTLEMGKAKGFPRKWGLSFSCWQLPEIIMENDAFSHGGILHTLWILYWFCCREMELCPFPKLTGKKLILYELYQTLPGRGSHSPYLFILDFSLGEMDYVLTICSQPHLLHWP